MPDLVATKPNQRGDCIRQIEYEKPVTPVPDKVRKVIEISFLFRAYSYVSFRRPSHNRFLSPSIADGRSCRPSTLLQTKLSFQTSRTVPRTPVNSNPWTSHCTDLRVSPTMARVVPRITNRAHNLCGDFWMSNGSIFKRRMGQGLPPLYDNPLIITPICVYLTTCKL